MAKKAMIIKNLNRKYKIQHRNRCSYCGRPRGYIGDFKMCRLCFRKFAGQGLIPGIKKASW